MSQEEPLLSDYENFKTTKSIQDVGDDHAAICLVETGRDRGAGLSDRSLCGADDPADCPKPSTTVQRWQMAMLKVVESLILRVVSILLIFIDIILVIISLTVYGVNTTEEPMGYEVVAVIIAVFFMVELGMRLFARGKSFFHYWYEILDMAVIVVSFSLTIVYVCANVQSHKYIKLLIVGRLTRILLVLRIVNERYQLSRVSRHLVSQNKRRFVKDGFDLDLTYVTERVMAMGFPSSGKAGLYRNAASEVVRFLDTRHQDHYKVYNLCREKAYDPSLFHGRVVRILIDDHNVPLLADLVAVCEDIHKWMEQDSKNVVAVHCKGGKGRTGTVICCSLLRSGMFDSANGSLSYFGARRTDRDKGLKYQGVQTPSQSRYVHYYESVVQEMGGAVPDPAKYKINTLTIHGIRSIGVGDGSDLSIEVLNSGVTMLECNLHSFSHIEAVDVNHADDVLTVTLRGDSHLRIGGDIKLRFLCSSKIKTRGLYDNCLFFCWFHTSFINDDRLFLRRHELDNPHKPKLNKIFKENFALEVLFTRA